MKFKVPKPEEVESVKHFVKYLDNLYSYNFNENEVAALASMALSGVDLEALVKEGKRSKFQISCKIKSLVYAEGKKQPELIERRSKEYDLFMKPVEAAPKKQTRKKKKED